MSYKRLLAVVCSHGEHICPVARDAILAFKTRYKPQTVVHLGDALDTAAFRTGAKGTPDESKEVEPDLDSGLGFIQELGTTHWLAGNHEDRYWSLADHYNAIVAYAAQQCINEITDVCKKRKIEFSEYTGIHQGIYFGGFRFMHGSMFSESATRDHAESVGNVVHGHNHRPAIAMARRSDAAMGFGLGTLTRRRAMGYAKNRRATLAWGQAFLWGEYNDREAPFTLCLGPQEQLPTSKWVLPG